MAIDGAIATSRRMETCRNSRVFKGLIRYYSKFERECSDNFVQYRMVLLNLRVRRFARYVQEYVKEMQDRTPRIISYIYILYVCILYRTVLNHISGYRECVYERQLLVKNLPYLILSKGKSGYKLYKYIVIINIRLCVCMYRKLRYNAFQKSNTKYGLKFPYTTTGTCTRGTGLILVKMLHRNCSTVLLNYP